MKNIFFTVVITIILGGCVTFSFLQEDTEKSPTSKHWILQEFLPELFSIIVRHAML